MSRLNLNPELSKGDRIMCISMDDDHDSVPPGMPGTVTNVITVFGYKQYNVNWDNGSKLALIDGVDKWITEEDFLNRRRKKTDESVFVTTKKNFLSENFYQRNLKLLKNFKFGIWYNYLNKLRHTGVTNMIGAAPYLYMGRQRIENQHRYDEMGEEQRESFQDVLDMADEVRDMMIRGGMKHLEDENREVTPESVKSLIRYYSGQIILAYAQMKGGNLTN